MTPLRQIESRLGRIIGQDLPILKKIKKYVIESGGKRIRPLTHYFTLRMLGADHREWADVAAIGELIHNASLLHDDVVDESDLRRGKPSAPILFGNKTVVLAGDYLLACGLNHLSTLEHSRELLVVFSRTIRLLSEGELIQMEWEGNLKIPPKAYERIIYCKTACLFGAMTETAALLAGKPAAVQAEYRKFGERLGRYFQIRDDYLDYFTPAKETGKKEMQDFERGLVTWPVMRLLETKKGVDVKLAAIWKDRRRSLPKMLDLIEERGIQNSARQYLKAELDAMLGFLAKHPASEYRDRMHKTLQSLAL